MRLGAGVWQVEELKAALAGEKRGVVATLVREAAEPMREQEAHVQELRDEVQRQRDRADEVRPSPAAHSGGGVGPELHSARGETSKYSRAASTRLSLCLCSR